jgi:hypothetical protein
MRRSPASGGVLRADTPKRKIHRRPIDQPVPVIGPILPRKGLSELKKLLETGDEGVVSLGFKDNMGLVTKDKIELFHAPDRRRLGLVQFLKP